MLYESLISIFCITSLLSKGPHFSAETIDDGIGNGHGLAIGDVDGDGKPDILLTDRSQLIWYRNGDWKRFVMMDHMEECDHVSIAARDIDGDGKVEIAVGACAAHYLVRPADPTQLWTAIKLDQESPVRQLQWVKVGQHAFQLVVLPQAANIRAYEKPTDPTLPWRQREIRQPMPVAYHLTVYDYGDRELFYVGGDNGLMGFSFKESRWIRNTADWLARGRHIGKARIGSVASRNAHVFSAIEPVNGHMVTLYTPGLADSLMVSDKIKRIVLERKMNDGHGLGMADFLGLSREQVVAGWKKPNEDGHFGIKLYVPFNSYWEAMDVYWVDRGGIACDALQVADMDGDGKPDIVATGRSTHNLKIYWNQTL